MALQEKYRWFLEVTEQDAVQVRRERIIYDDVSGEVFTNGLYHRHVVMPGQDYSGEHPKIKAVCDQLFTPATLAFHQARRDLHTKDVKRNEAKNATAADPTPENEALEAQAEAEYEAAQAALEAAEAAWEAQYDV